MTGALSLKAEAISRGARMLRTALGPAIATWLEDPVVVEVMLNPDGHLWVDRLTEGLADTGERLSAADGERIVRLVAHHVETEVHPACAEPSDRLIRGAHMIGTDKLKVFRTTKSILDTRPIYHQTDEAIRGHVFCSFLALVLRKALEDSLAAARLKPEWGALLRELDRLQEIQTEQEGKHFILRTPVTGDVGRVFQAVGIALP